MQAISVTSPIASQPVTPPSKSVTSPDDVRPGAIDSVQIRQFVDKTWDESIVPTLEEYIRIPNKSPDFDPQWAPQMDQALGLIRDWCDKHSPPGAKAEVVRLPGRSPLLYIDIPAEGTPRADDPVLMYGHLDKQPETTGWSEGLDPRTAVLRDGKLFGRGGADDGYAAFASVTAIEALHEQKIAHSRCVILIEAAEESGSPDLAAYVEHLAPSIGTPSLVVCLDSGCGDYEHLWSTTSLRGMIGGALRVDMLTQGVHSGEAGGVVPSSFRIVRELLDRVEDARTGRVRIPECHARIPVERREQLRSLISLLGNSIFSKFPFVKGARPDANDGTELMLNNTWRPSLTVTGAEGLPPLVDAGNVLLPYTALKLSMRLPPTVDSAKALTALKRTLEEDSPYGSRVAFEGEHADGWNAPHRATWLKNAMDEASRAYFGHEPLFIGEGGTIPFINMLGQRFPKAQFLITGVLGPGSNAHGPNESLDISMGKKLTCCVANVVARQAERALPS